MNPFCPYTYTLSQRHINTLNIGRWRSVCVGQSVLFFQQSVKQCLCVFDTSACSVSTYAIYLASCASVPPVHAHPHASTLTHTHTCTLSHTDTHTSAHAHTHTGHCVKWNFQTSRNFLDEILHFYFSPPLLKKKKNPHSSFLITL